MHKSPIYVNSSSVKIAMGLFRSEQAALQRRLRKACENRNLEKMRAALDAGAPPKGLGDTCYRGFTNGVRLLLQHHADPNDTDGYTWPPLTRAANDGYLEIAQLLLEAGAKIDAADRSGETALHRAAARGQGALVKLLLEKGADPALTDHRMNTPADAAQKDHPRLADLIRGKVPPTETPAADVPGAPVLAAPVTGWHLTAPDEVSSVAEKPAIGYSVTEIFNFGAGIYTRIARNLSSGGESQSVRFFDEFLDRTPLERARAALVKLGGDAASGAGAKVLDKRPLPPPAPSGGA
jgi:hypothetical protein